MEISIFSRDSDFSILSTTKTENGSNERGEFLSIVFEIFSIINGKSPSISGETKTKKATLTAKTEFFSARSRSTINGSIP